MRTLAAAFLFAFALCAPARADPMVGADPAFIDRCLSAAAPDTRGQCKGALANPCLEAEGFESTMALVLCWSAEADAWGALIDTQLTTLRARAPERSALLDGAQADWLAWRESECTYQSEPSAGGSGVQVVFALCAADLDAERAIALMAAVDQ